VESAEPEGTVVSQNPAGGEKAGRGSNVNIEVAIPARPTVPDVLGKRIEDARAAFQGAKIQLDFTQGSQCFSSAFEPLFRPCVVVGVNPDIGTKVNVNALVLVRTEPRTGIIVDPPFNVCKANPQFCIERLQR
jgi:hypothetical protein